VQSKVGVRNASCALACCVRVRVQVDLGEHALETVVGVTEDAWETVVGRPESLKMHGGIRCGQCREHAAERVCRARRCRGRSGS